MPRNSKSPVFEVSLKLSDLTVRTGLRIFDLRSIMALQACLRAGSFGRVGPKRIIFTLCSGDAEWTGPTVFSLARPGESESSGQVEPAFLAVLGHYWSEASPALREEFLSSFGMVGSRDLIMSSYGLQ